MDEQIIERIKVINETLDEEIESNYGVLVTRQFDNSVWWAKHYKWKVKHGLIDESTAKRLLGEREALCFTSSTIS